MSGMVRVAGLGLVVVHRRIAVHIRPAHNDVDGSIHAVVDPMYAILLALVTIIVWANYNSANMGSSRMR